MKINVHKIERVLRVIAGIMILSLVFVGPKSLWGLIGLIPLITGLVGLCPLYSIFGFSTSKSKKGDEE
jgi:cadmium resistance protein CadD (predicted permease)